MRCYYCSQPVTGNFRLYDGKLLCDNCIKERIVKCARCSMEMDNINAIEIDEKHYCQPCALSFLGQERQRLMAEVKRLEDHIKELIYSGTIGVRIGGA